MKILAEGDLTKKLTITVHAASAAAKAKIEQAGGRIEIIETTKIAAPAA